MIQKGVGVCSSAHPGLVGSRIAPSQQDRQRQLAHASTNYKFMYIETHHVDASVVICLLVKLNLRDSRVTTTDVRKRLSHI